MNTSLQAAIIEQSGGIESWNEMKSDIANYGIDGGFSGWIYYNETTAFYDANKRDVDNALVELAHECGQSAANMLSCFNCVDLLESEAEMFLMGHINEDNEEHELQNETLNTVKNAMSWFAVEEMARNEQL